MLVYHPSLCASDLCFLPTYLLNSLIVSVCRLAEGYTLIVQYIWVGIHVHFEYLLLLLILSAFVDRCVGTFCEIAASVMTVDLLTHPITLLLMQTTLPSCASTSWMKDVRGHHVAISTHHHIWLSRELRALVRWVSGLFTFLVLIHYILIFCCITCDSWKSKSVDIFQLTFDNYNNNNNKNYTLATIMWMRQRD